jgi:hypothetical protein
MLPLITISAAIIFFVLWKSGILDELSKWSQNLSRSVDQPKKISDETTDPEMSKRLEVFEEFIDDLPDDDLD